MMKRPWTHIDRDTDGVDARRRAGLFFLYKFDYVH